MPRKRTAQLVDGVSIDTMGEEGAEEERGRKVGWETNLHNEIA
jgi:hypothetical protein